MKTKVFAYKGYVGILSSPEADLVAKPGNGNIGCVADAANVEFSQDAIDLLKKVKRSSDDIGDVDVFKAGDGVVVFGWLGGYMKAFKPEDVEGSSTYNPSLLVATENVEVPKGFIDFIDTLE